MGVVSLSPPMKIRTSFWLQIRGGYGDYDWNAIRAQVLHNIEPFQPDPAWRDEISITMRPDEKSGSKPNGATFDVEFYV